MSDPLKPELPADERIGRRAILAVGGLTAAGIVAAGTYHQLATAQQRQAQVFIARNQRYDGGLARTIRDGLVATGDGLIADALGRVAERALDPDVVPAGAADRAEQVAQAVRAWPVDDHSGHGRRAAASPHN